MPNVLAFAGAALLLAMVPGPSTAVVLRQTLRSGRRAGIAATLANELGALFWVLLAAFGLSSLVAASQTAYDVLRLIGALVLIVLGAQSLWHAHARRQGSRRLDTSLTQRSARTQAQAPPPSTSSQHSQYSHEYMDMDTPGQRALGGDSDAPGATWRSFRIGLVTTVANPKAAVFAAAFLPQFVPPHAPVLATLLFLAAVWVLVDVCWYVVVVALISRVQELLTRSIVWQRLEQVTGLALMGLGARLAFTRR